MAAMAALRWEEDGARRWQLDRKADGDPPKRCFLFKQEVCVCVCV